MRYHRSRRRRRQALEHDRAGQHIDHSLLILEIEVMVVRSVGIEVGPGRFDRDLAKEPNFLELVQRIVDRGQRDIEMGLSCFTMQLLSAHVAVRTLEEQLGESKPLSCRPEPAHAQHCGQARTTTHGAQVFRALTSHVFLPPERFNFPLTYITRA